MLYMRSCMTSKNIVYTKREGAYRSEPNRPAKWIWQTAKQLAKHLQPRWSQGDRRLSSLLHSMMAGNPSVSMRGQRDQVMS